MSKYAPLVRLTSPGFLVLAFLARLPASMIPLGVITLVAASTHSFAAAGGAAAAYGIGAAVGGPIIGGLADKFGQRSVGLVAALINAVALVGIVATVHNGLGAAVMAAIAGFSTPQVGPLVRVRWAALLQRRQATENTPTAFAYEGAADELSYMAGPALVGVIALLGGVWLPLLIAAGLTLAAAVPFALHHTAVQRGSTMSAAGVHTPKVPVALLVFAMVGIGLVFGAAQTGVTAFAGEHNMPGAAGLIYAALGVGSAAAGLATAWLPARIGPVARYTGSAVALALGGLVLVLAPASLAGVLVGMLVVGVVSAPYLISVYALANETAPIQRAGVIMTLLGSGVVGGVALGAAIAGRLADTVGYQGAFVVPLGAGILAVVVALVYRALPTPALSRA